VQYITGIHALNLPCALLTCGDWHRSALRWEDITIRNSEQSVFGEYGIELDKPIPNHTGRWAVANHIRALLDLLETSKFSVAQGMNNDYICNNGYTSEVFGKVALMRGLAHWPDIDCLMGREYHTKWLDYKKQVNL
jgi:hypothetical protein